MRKTILLILMIGIMLQMFAVFAYADNWTCRFCNKENNSKFCPDCGRPREEAEVAANNWICRFCNKENNSKFCPDCGRPREEAEPSATTKLSLKAGDYYTFGSYEQDNNINNGKEPIEWLVLEVDEANSKALLTSRYALDGQKYNTRYESITWEKCTLRTWLNDNFFNDAFSKSEQKLIAETKVSADKNPKYSIDAGKDTTDKIFLLSITEAEKYFKSNQDRVCQGTVYCYAQGAHIGIDGNCHWWFRSPGNDSGCAASVHGGRDGGVISNGDVVSNVNGIRPALWINLES